ncbi:pollen receptor-like kinase 5 [Senna tora]|uniref:Pollen receptor-like kinase 5 n=1 Tax=Senna tora TaxID=362788 RepID=A0A834WDM6_9FABA|nr:pollen receptor-like kinase 5 [Senna tora]
MAYQTAYYCLLPLVVIIITLAICSVPSLGEIDPQLLVKFKSFLFNANALNNWGNESISLCNWTGLLCTNHTFHGLRLENMGLSGMIDVDTLLKLSNLTSFSIINNSFEGPMPEFRKLERLKGLFLSNNKFTGEIPDDAFEGMKYLKKIFLAENGFTGHIPSSLAESPRLLDLDLHGNIFQGNIPKFRQNHFRVFNLSHNQLEGPIPESLSNYDPSSYYGNKGVCGKPLYACSSLTSYNNHSTISHQEKGKKHPVVIAAIVVVAVLALASIVALIFIIHRRRRQWKISQNNEGLRESSTTHSIDVTDDGFKKGENGELSFVKEEYREEFDLYDLLRASAEVLGSGRFGSTYKANVSNGSSVVVKRFKHMNRVGKEEFSEHITKLGRLTHPNLLPLVAFCYREEEKLLVYNFVENGSLASHLHGRVRVNSGLDWPTRLNIIKGVARGLAYLYKEFPGQKLPHGHLKSSNVLLNQSMEPHLTEYGLIPVMNKNHAKEFMAAYKAPESYGPNKKTDVWCLGILILEVLTGKLPENYMRKGKEGDEDLGRWVRRMVREEWTGEVLDKEIMGVRNGEGEILKLLEIGMCCCEWDVENRWDWREAVAKIEELKERDREEEEEEDDDEWSSNASEDETELSPSHNLNH